ncbi:MAG: diacylglycerol kinase family lipid kinase [Planctomycetia bacterium]|nr:diacylglycerol kinase family lipid kinase [Planctomycetia bacterium]
MSNRADLCVIFNPAAGRRRLSEHLERFRRVFGRGFEPLPTQHAGHAEELAVEAAQAGYRVVAAAGGDGTVHEVANGLLRAARPEVVLHVLPMGSANDYAHCLRRERANGQPSDAVRRVDVGLARSPDGRQRYFVNGLGLGFNGAVTLESRKIRHVRGLTLYGLALLRALCYQFRCPPLTVAFDDVERQAPTLGLTVNLGTREGNFVLAPDARLDDGWFDFVQAGDLQRWELLRLLPALVAGGMPDHHPKIWKGRCRQVSIRAAAALTVHLDGEFFCLPKENVREIEVTLLPAALAVTTTG